MKRENSLKKITNFLELVKSKNKYYSNNYVIYAEKNRENKIKIGISVSKKLFAKAVIRNKIKREVRSFFDDFTDWSKSLNILIKINNVNYLTNSYLAKKKEFFDTYKKVVQKFKTI
ncbi:ribonuclease P protein component [Mycoplasmoides gallisepticum CA06_2006.052-5-2P]|uniref:Ribonuclease P protein component n=1 Tax=Mycoplasmoides gallisepticum WI01_2001.043-13-2P TaxID=1159201 RepID=J3T8V7_MYCGL|nr:ribonuclease P protein component [Mycoplasmoides gallisepticum]AFP75647.1 ribonuclease P protein component [Mycoplasmoides gallisepticum VA94_7994-1-7P]AFP76414.1 ribonuclease P protein component [Mycoplasmoides gallisepticum NC95_13295-2-2P]AFP77168.1 ribonuclease P protein component [Mycoplasmoides gallisepticum NC96_1596-4-2P]AFP77939.1 ribonuclease P protein component [Mycoplasmoides gallisepticum NY01_2001.047-5-1P]AFP78699.1 ribonuclease P protein component [Mycoplasmoides galliseptic